MTGGNAGRLWPEATENVLVARLYRVFAGWEGDSRDGPLVSRTAYLEYRGVDRVEHRVLLG